MMNLTHVQNIEANIPAELKRSKIWVGFEFIPQEGKKSKKEPTNAVTGGKAQSNNPKTWHSFSDVMAKVLNYDAIGIALGLPYVGTDLDHSVKDGVISPAAQKIIKDLDSYTEFSPSGTGVHILSKGTLPQGRKFGEIDVEMYQTVRFLTMTGNIVPGCRNTIEDRSSQVLALFNE